jgi:DNA-binding response OmpR family regulator
MADLKRDFTEPQARLLIVDDESYIRLVIAKALSLAGYHVEAVATGDEALALLAHSSFDLMLLDMLMPGMTGDEVLWRARELKPELLIIVLTGNATLENAIVAVKSAAADYLLKPTSIHQIIDAITKALQKRVAKMQKDYLGDVLGDTMVGVHQEDVPPTLSHITEKSWSRFVFARPLRLDRLERIVEFVEKPSQTITLSKGETAVLGSLMETPGQIYSCQQLVQKSWGYKFDPIEAESVIRPYISRLRCKIEINPSKPLLIRTVRRRGYQFAAAKA